MPTAIHRKKTELDGLTFFYLDTETSGPTMLCLHGRFGRAETWFGLVQQYADRYRVIAPDQRGHGLSDKPIGKYTADEMALDAAHLIKHLDCAPVIVVGHSMGGRIAGYLAAQHPALVSYLVVLDQTARGFYRASTKGAGGPQTFDFGPIEAEDVGQNSCLRAAGFRRGERSVRRP